MFEKKRIIWWEREATARGASHARARGALADGGRSRTAPSPFYGPVTLLLDSDEGSAQLELAAR